MARSDRKDPTTYTLVRRAGDWGNHSAWREIETRFSPILRLWCRRFRFDAETTDELCQRILIRLAERLPSFDPRIHFRGWLWSLFRSRAIDLLRERRKEEKRSQSLDDSSLGSAQWVLIRTAEMEIDVDQTEAIEQAEEITTTVRDRVEPENWDIFWKVEIDGWTITEAAKNSGKTYAAAYQAHGRILRKLKAEAARRRSTAANVDSPSPT